MPTGEGPCFLGSIVLGKYPLGNSAVSLGDLTDLPREGTCLPSPKPCQAPDCLRRCRTLSAWRVPSSREEGKLAWESSSLSVGERVLSSGEAWELPAWEISLSTSERVLSTREAWELHAWESALSAGKRVLSSRESLGPACLGTAGLVEFTLCQWKSAIY